MDYINRGAMHPSDAELVEKARRKDKQAFTELFDRYKDKILGYLYRYIGDYQLAEDLTVETFLSAYTNLDAYKEMGIFSSWLYRIATNCAKKELRKRRHSVEVSLEKHLGQEEEGGNLEDLIADDRMRPDYDARQAELKETIYRIISSLEKKYGEVLLLCDVEGLSYEETATALGCNPITVGTRLRRARKMFYETLKKKGFNI